MITRFEPSLFAVLATPIIALQDNGGLKEYIPSEFIPDFLSGPCQVCVAIVTIAIVCALIY